MQTFGGATPLMYACQQSRDHQVLDILTKQPYAVKDRDRTLKTPLHYCAENPNTNCAEILLKFAPELVNAQDENGYCTLHLAVIAGNKSLIKFLIGKGADVNIYDNEGHSAIHWAIVSSEKEALEIIFRAGANPSTPDIHGGYPLHYAVQMCGSNIDYVRNYEDTIRVVETLLNFGVDVNVKDKDGRQPILWAASAGSADAVIHLVSGGACVEAGDKDGLTALHCAASRGHTTTLDTLITLCGTNVDVIDGNGCSALFYAVTLGHADATEILLQLGGEPNRQDRRGRTPAHCGAAKGQLETLRILQKHGGNLWLRNVKGDIPLHEAVASGRKDLVLWLLAQNPDAVNIANNDGRCPLHIAAMYNNTEMVKILLDSKSLVNPVMRTSKGVLMTPLNVALCKGHRSCGKYLQLHGGVPFSKVAKIEPASAFAFRVSPTPEVMADSVEINAETPPQNKTKVSKSNTSTDVQIVKTETDKKKVYRRRKKRKTKDLQDSDSDESAQKTKTNRKNSQNNEEDDKIDDESDEVDEKIKKVRIQNGQSEKATKANTLAVKSHGNDSVVQETLTVKRMARARTEPKPFPRSKSIKESKNVNNLSPDDFPPMMQAVNQLDTVITEPEIDVNKSANEYDTEGGLKTPNPPSGELSSNEQTMAKSATSSNEQATVKSTSSGNEQITEVFEKEEIKIEIEQDEEKTEEKLKEQHGKGAPQKDEKVKKSKEVRTPGSKSSDEGTPHQTDKTIKPTTTRSSSKKDDKTTKQGQKTSISEGNDKSKTPISPRGPKSASSTPGKDKSDKEAKKDTQQEETPLSEEKPPENLETKPKEAGIEKPEPEINSYDGNRIEEKQEEVAVVVVEETKAVKVDETIEKENPETPKIEEEKDSEKPVICVNDTSKDEGSRITVGESVLVKEAEILEIHQEPPKPSIEVISPEIEKTKEEVEVQKAEIETLKVQQHEEVKPMKIQAAEDQPDTPELEQTQEEQPMEKQPTAVDTTMKPIIVEEKVLEDKPPEEKESPPAVVLMEEPKSSAVEQSNELVETSEQRNELPEVGKIDTNTIPVYNDDPAADTAVTSKQEKLPLEKVKPEGTSEIQREEPEVTENNTADGNITKGTRRKSETPKHDDVNNGKTNNQSDVNAPEESSNWEKETNGNHNNQRPNKPVRVSRLCRRHKDFKDDMNQASVTQLVQNTIRKYHMERGIFYQLLELKRYQIRSGKANEQVLVKRLADEYERSRVFLGMKPYTGLYKFREFEKFLYDQLKALNNRRGFVIPEIKSYDDIDALSGFLKKSRYKIINEISQPDMVCTCITQRCHHSACAYTSVPCSAYIADLRHHKHHRKKKECFFPRIDQPQLHKSFDAQKFAAQPATLELVQGSEKHVITLPQNYPDKTKRYYVTFTIKGVNSPKEDVIDSKDYFKHRHAKSV